MRFWLVTWRAADDTEGRHVFQTKREAEKDADYLRLITGIKRESVAVSALYVETPEGGRRAAAWWGLKLGLAWLEQSQAQYRERLFAGGFAVSKLRSLQQEPADAEAQEAK